jgi:replicative DNA helicase
MTEREKLITQVLDAPRDTPQAIVDAVNQRLSAGAWSKVADYIMDYCYERGIEGDELAFIERETARGKAREERERKKQAAQTLIERTRYFQEGLNDEQIPLNDQKLMEAETELGKLAAELRDAGHDDVEDCRATWEKDSDEWNRDNDHDFAPYLFNHLSFPNGSVSYIGARTGRGKTTVMVNLALEALRDHRGALFISLEESNRQILRRFVLCLAYSIADELERQELQTVTNPYTNKTDPKNAYKNLRRGRVVGGKGAKTFVTLINSAISQIEDWLQTGSLALYDMRGKSLNSILRLVRNMSQDDVVLFDYIQKIPAAGDIHSGNPDLERIRLGSQELINAATQAGCVVISGAQLNRESQSSNAKGDDTFSDADFRGCGDIEQDAHNAIGIGRSADKTLTYYGIIKTREDQIDDLCSVINFKGGYSFMSLTDDTFTPNPKASAKKKSSSRSSKTDNELYTIEELE